MEEPGYAERRRKFSLQLLQAESPTVRAARSSERAASSGSAVSSSARQNPSDSPRIKRVLDGQIFATWISLPETISPGRENLEEEDLSRIRCVLDGQISATWPSLPVTNYLTEKQRGNLSFRAALIHCNFQIGSFAGVPAFRGYLAGVGAIFSILTSDLW